MTLNKPKYYSKKELFYNSKLFGHNVDKHLFSSFFVSGIGKPQPFIKKKINTCNSEISIRC